MFGHGFFGAGYYGPGYWGPGGSAPAPVTVQEGWKPRSSYLRKRQKREEDELCTILPIVLDLIDRH